ncbi:MAG: hypothetical protein KDB80_12660, partial [Planctomycetes bacterium]|nr:hypothetical protein [Planctomycetota bacterium]
MSLLGASLATFAAAQQLTLSPSLATPGQVVTASLFNDTGGLLAVADTCEATLLWHSGELAEGLLVLGQACDALVAISAGQTHTWQFLAPSSPGTFLATFDPAIGNRAVARLDVTAASASPQQLAFFPKGIHFPHSAHQADFSDPASLPWQLSNVGTAAHTFGPNDRIEITVPGGTQVLRTLSLDTLLVGAGKAVDVYLPIAGLTPGPYTVVAIFQDPGTGGEVRTRAGIQQRASRVDLHRMGRRSIAIGETTEFGFTLAGFPT